MKAELQRSNTQENFEPNKMSKNLICFNFTDLVIKGIFFNTSLIKLFATTSILLGQY